MPNPARYKDKSHYMSDCMRTTKSEGKNRAQSLGECLGWWKNKHPGSKDAQSGIDYNKYLNSTPEDYGSQYFVLRIPKEVVPPNEGDKLVIKGRDVIVSSVSTPEDIAKGRGGPVAKSMKENGIGWDVNCLPEGHEYLKNMTFSKRTSIDKLAVDLEKAVEEADKSDKPSVFLGGSCKDNKWREDIKEEFKDKLFFIDPFDPNWEPDDNIYQELAAIINADYTVFYDGGKGSDKEMKFLDNTDREYEEFGDLDKLKEYLERVSEPVIKKACISQQLRKIAKSIEAREKLGFLGIKVPENIAKKIKELDDTIPDNELYKDSADVGTSSSTGRELHKHITVAFGLTFSDPNKMKEFLKDTKSFMIRLNKTGMFTLDKCDVLKIGINSPELQDLHQRIKEKFLLYKEHPQYFPHITNCYCLKGYVEKYCDIDFSEYYFEVKEVFFSYDHKDTVIKLKS